MISELIITTTHVSFIRLFADSLISCTKTGFTSGRFFHDQVTPSNLFLRALLGSSPAASPTVLGLQRAARIA